MFTIVTIIINNYINIITGKRLFVIQNTTNNISNAIITIINIINNSNCN